MSKPSSSTTACGLGENSIPGVPRLRVRPSCHGYGTYIWRGRNPVTGKKTAITLGKTTKLSLGQAIAAAERIDERQRQGLELRVAHMTLSEAFDAVYLPHIRKVLKSWRNHLGRFNEHIRAVLGDRPIYLITLGELVLLIDGLQPSPKSFRKIDQLAPATINRVTCLLKAIFSKLCAWGLIDKNPAERLMMRRESNARHRVLSEAESIRLGGALSRAPLLVRCLVKLALATGMRLSEMLGARFSDVSYENATLELRHTKNGRTRLVALSPEAIAIIRQLEANRINEFLFPSKTGIGSMWRPSKAFDLLLENAQIEGLTIHDLRRSHGSTAIQCNNVSVIDVSRHLGHSNVAVTERSYLVSCDARIRHAATEASRAIHRRLAQGVMIPTCRSVLMPPQVRFVFAGKQSC